MRVVLAIYLGLLSTASAQGRTTIETQIQNLMNSHSRTFTTNRDEACPSILSSISSSANLLRVSLEMRAPPNADQRDRRQELVDYALLKMERMIRAHDALKCPPIPASTLMWSK